MDEARYYTARYKKRSRRQRMKGRTTVNELWLRAVVAGTDIPEAVTGFLSDDNGNPKGNALPWDFVLEPDSDVVFIDTPSHEGSEPQ